MVCSEEAVYLAIHANGRALLQSLVRLAEPSGKGVTVSVFAGVFNSLINFLEQRAHNAGLRFNGGQHDWDIHDLFLSLLPAIAAGDNGKRLECVVPAALAKLDVFEVELDEGAAVCFDEVRDLRRVHDSVLEFHAAETCEFERLGALDIAAHGWVGHLVLYGLHAGFLVQ